MLILGGRKAMSLKWAQFRVFLEMGGGGVGRPKNKYFGRPPPLAGTPPPDKDACPQD